METLIDAITRTSVWVARNSLESSLLLLAFLLLFLSLGRHLAPGLRVVLWAVIGIRLLLPFAPPSSISVHNLLPELTSAPEMAASPTPPFEIVMEGAKAPGARALSDENPVPLPVPARASSPAPANFARFSLDWHQVLGMVWATVSLGLLAFAISRQRAAHRRIVRFPSVRSESLKQLYAECAKQSGVRRRPRLVSAPAGSGVAVFGFLRESHLLLPADLEDRYSESEIRGILLHELAHVRRGDLLINWIVFAVQCLHWFNPLVWFAGRRFLADREVLCDRAALRGLDSSQRRDYGTALLKALQLGRAPQTCPALVPFVSRKAELEHRLTMIAKPHPRNSLLQVAAGLTSVVIAVATFTSARADEERGERDNRRESARDGAESREGSREGDRPREGEREGDRPREGSRDGDRPREGARDGENSREGARDGEAPRIRADHEILVLRDGAVLDGRKYTSMADFRAALNLDPNAAVLLKAGPDTPFKTVTAVLEEVKRSGVSNVSFAVSGPGENARDDDRPREGEMRREGDGGSREGARDGDRPREGARDGEGGSREGARDGDRPREGEMRREGDGGSREGARDGDRPRAGAREGEGGSREGARDGDRPREGEMRREGDGGSREGARDGDRPREGARDGEGGSREGARDGESSASTVSDRQLNQLTRIYGAYDKNGDRAVNFEEWVAMKNYELTADQKEREKGWFDEADGNGDGSVTLGEWIDWKASQGQGNRD